ncbi:undecaprenyl-phosphate glucose phosphotransferase [Bordetella avium]|nr:undecaprenyl-phosphate glucose phosphotransferase [Bordetella avium]AZY53342.1 undecaprenyl-phosphate glucose phosphotransferase [Bordetella avium]RIQ13065.1 undecaprenyl-phosphate glucose phosphotransferase [Bordetella avium]RIQ17333.1 undecaprenyl-phosphate glucose phosphotransferase [Bordetella avium]RIQ33818.1 undecaprenyl-phosphate glucose phosphotransferase [Bordetella avium]
MALVGLVCALINSGSFLILAGLHGIHAPLYMRWIPALIGVVTFITYTRFGLLVSARSMWWMLGRGLLRWFNILFLTVLALFFLPHSSTDTEWLRLLLLHWAAVALPLTAAGLYGLRHTAYRLNNMPASRRAAVFFGMGPEARKLAMRLERSPILGIYTAGYYAEQPVNEAKDENIPPYLGRYQDALARIGAGEYNMAFVTLEDDKQSKAMLELMSHLYDSTAEIYLMPESPLLSELAISSADIAGVPLLSLHETRMVGLARSIKRLTDLLLGGLMLLVLSPLMLLIAIAIKLDSRGPVIFRQQRYGERGMPITVLKFRSMRTDAGLEADGTLRQAQVGDKRVTRVGRFLRKSSLDELPQLFNVLGGSMSLVGPRPHASEHNEFYRRQIRGYMLRHSVKPGITGWAQIHGLRGETETPEKMRLRVRYDRYYITNWSLMLDLRIMVRTVLVLFWDRNAY